MPTNAQCGIDTSKRPFTWMDLLLLSGEHSPAPQQEELSDHWWGIPDIWRKGEE